MSNENALLKKTTNCITQTETHQFHDRSLERIKRVFCNDTLLKYIALIEEKVLFTYLEIQNDSI